MIQIDARNITWDLGRDITYEVLIENLGGYESAKSKFRDNGSLHAERLKKALLEYRRQHNIFEIGDKVVWINSIAPKDSRLFEIEESLGEKPDTWSFRHATDAEIKAGKRLEMNDEN